MTIQTATASVGQPLSNSIRTQYIEDYLEGAEMERLYDQLATPIGKPMETLQRGSSVQVDFLSDMQPGTTAISEVADITPQALRDATASISPTSRGEALQCSEKLLLQAYTDYGAKQFKRVGKGLMESLEVLARDAATQGSLVVRPNATARTRITLSAILSGHRATDGLFSDMTTMLMNYKCPSFTGMGGRRWAAIMHPAVFHDIRQSGNVVSIGTYQDKSILLNYELGSIGPFSLVVSPWAKVFYSTGAAAATNEVATTLSTAASALSKTITVAAATHMDGVVSPWITIGTLETGDTHYPLNERVRYLSHTGTTITIMGEGANGGLRFDHASATAVTNKYSVYTIVFGGPTSLAKVFATEVGEYGEIVGPKRDGLIDQFVTLGFKWYGNYGRISETWLARAEVSASADSV